MTESAPGVWRLRVFTGKRTASGSPKQVSRTYRYVPPKGSARPGDGRRKAEAELAKLIAEVANGCRLNNGETFSDLLDQFLEHVKSLGRSPTTVREYERMAEKVLKPALG